MNRKFTLIIVLFLCLCGTYRAYGQAGTALKFNGGSEHVDLPDMPFAQNSPYTVEGWARINNGSLAGGQVIADFYPTASSSLGTNGNFIYLDILESGKLRYLHRPSGSNNGGDQLTSTTSLANNTWFHYAATYDSKGTMSLYINGVLEAQKLGTTPTYVPEMVDGRLGNLHSDGSRKLKGTLDELRLWSRALDATDIEAHYQKSFSDPTTPAAPTTCLAAYYKFNAGSGTSAADASGNGYTGSVIGTNNSNWVTSGAGVTAQAAPACSTLGTSTNYALDFDGTNDYVAIPTLASFENSTFTVESWFATAATTSGVLFEAFENSSSAYLSIETQASGILRVVYRPNGGNAGGIQLLSTSAVNTGTWKHVAVVLNINNTLSLYIDGVEQATSGTMSRITDATVNASIGRRSNGAVHFNGKIDELRIWSRGLAAEDILAHYDDSFTDAENIANCLEVYYDFEDSFGTSVTDRTTNGNTGTLTNMDNADWIVSGAGATAATAPNCADLGGDVNYALNFDGVNEQVLLPVLNTFDNSTFTVESWFRTEPGIASGVLFDAFELSGPDGTTLTGNYITIQITTAGKLQLTYRSPASSAGGQGLISTTSVNTGSWFHYAVVLNPDHTLSLYINGVEEDTSTGTVSLIDDNSVYAKLGALSNNTRYLAGQMDEVRLWSRALAAEDVIDLYDDSFTNAPSAGECLDVYYQFEESLGSTATDASGNNNDGSLLNMEDNDYVLSGASVTAVNAPDCATLSGDIDYALNFDGVNDYVELPTLTFLANTGFSVQGWFRTDPNVNGVLFELFPVGGTDGKNYMSVQTLTDGRLVANYRSPANNAGGPALFSSSSPVVSLADGNWHHYTVVLREDLKMFSLYVDGVLASESAANYQPLPGDVSATIGRLSSGGTGSRYFSGEIDETRVWYSALKPAGVAETYNKTYTNSGETAACLGAYYRFEESIGTAAVDATGNGNDGTLNNMSNNDYVLSGAPVTSQPSVACSAVAPVELTYFTARVEAGSVNLSWETASEQGNRGFEVLHSADGSAWTTIGFVEGAGTSDQTQRYGYVHDQPVGGDNFYRLKQLDFDGAFAYSGIALATLTDQAGALQVAPNPVRNGQLAVSIPAAHVADAELRLFSARGELVLTRKLSQPTTTVETGSLPRGVYVAVAIMNGDRYTRKVVIQ
ncbi:LamG-like jellyroll fold domain-containing protein [Lewinella sp. JB7]|uniref:LamG-like jellyroll fold domain-containing protein n=1 Tax=Lewinella sp. JB7 TaxID=2962887 RepID=UPI0020C948F6|nr:LamG-like jellyroll fold domain-containing protein [Lewinella sp. JB7]MCP9234375.1 LamG domain-containing protein [Lewinella sp. JB7]